MKLKDSIGMKSYVQKRIGKSKEYRRIETVSNTILYIGVIIVLTAAIYMILNLHKADIIIWKWFPFIILGVVLMYTSLIIRNIKYKN